MRADDKQSRDISGSINTRSSVLGTRKLVSSLTQIMLSAIQYCMGVCTSGTNELTLIRLTPLFGQGVSADGTWTKRGKSAVRTALRCIGTLFVRGVPVEIKEVNQYHASASTLTPLHDLPSYAWNHIRTFWAEPPVNRECRFRKHPCYSLVGAPLPRMSENESD